MLFTLIAANIKMMCRNRQAIFWALAFPLIFVTIFGLFRLDQPLSIHLLVVDHAQDQVSLAMVQSLSDLDRLEVEEREDEAEARQLLKDGEASYLLVIPAGLSDQMLLGGGQEPARITFLYDSSNQSAPVVIGVVQRFIEEANRQVTQAPILLELRSEGVQARQITYFDFLLVGIVGMGVMVYSVIGLGSSMALYREQKILKRILATPLKVRTFFAAQIIAYLLLAVVQSLIILAAGTLIFGGHIYGNILWILVLVVVANIVFLNLGFIVGGIANSVRAVDGLANAITMPMMFLSGTFFSRDTLPPVLADVVAYLPLSPLLDAMRGVALDARPFWDFPGELAILGGWIVVTSVVAIRVFKFS